MQFGCSFTKTVMSCDAGKCSKLAKVIFIGVSNKYNKIPFVRCIDLFYDKYQHISKHHLSKISPAKHGYFMADLFENQWDCAVLNLWNLQVQPKFT